MHGSCLRPSDRPMSATRLRCPTARTRAGGASSCRGSRRGPATACSTSPPAPERSRASSSARRRARSSASTRAPRCWPRRAAAPTGRIELVEASAERLPFADGEFDAPDLHLPAALRRRPGGDAARARSRRQAGRTIAGLEFGLPARSRGGRCGSCTSGSGCRCRRAPIAAAGARRARSSALRSATTTRAGRSRRLASAWRDAGHRRGADAPAVARRGDRDVGTRRTAQAGASTLSRSRGRLARLRDAAAPALHGLEPRLRRARRGARAALPHRPDGSGRWRRSRSPSASPRTRSTSCNGRPLRTQIPDADARRARGRRARRRRARSASGPRRRWGCGLLVFVAFGAFLVPAYNLELVRRPASTTAGGSRSPGAGSRC